MTRTILLATLLLAACNRGGAPDIAVSDAWARETATGSTAAYLTIANRGTASDRLISVAVQPPASASLHETSNEDGVSRMRLLANGVDIPVGGRVTFAPGGKHVMITGLDSPPASGDEFVLTLRFEKSGSRQIAAEVRPAIASAMRH